jgi:hypothetical protein
MLLFQGCKHTLGLRMRYTRSCLHLAFARELSEQSRI